MIIPVKTAAGGYNIVLERGSINKVNDYINFENKKVLIITDTGVPKEYSEAVAKYCNNPFIYVIDMGEKSKNFNVYKKILAYMIENGFDRKDSVVAVGGGVVGDLAGFVAATYMRGLDFYNIPTTLLSQVDSSIGGKVAVDFLGYKNIVGSFYQPKMVIIDSNVLKTLDKRQFAAGMAESVKMALTSDKVLFELIESNEAIDVIDEIIYRSLLVKKDVVEQDETEKGLRKILNFGHTIGHAFEYSAGLENYFHGECVAVGMLATSSKDVKKRLIPVLQKINLPTYIKGSKIKMKNAIKHDKKSAGNFISEIFVNEIGSFEMRDVTLDEIMKIIKEEYGV